VVAWTAPEVERPQGPLARSERAMLQAFLDWHRATLLYKCAGYARHLGHADLLRERIDGRTGE
jgi:hypothetical protein